MSQGWETDRTDESGSAVAVLERTTSEAIRPRRSRPQRLARRIRLARADAIIGGAYLALAVLVLSGQWRNPHDGYLIKSGQDQTMWEWFFAVTAHSIAHLENPLGTNLQNFPSGVNMMANTAMFGVGVPLTPVTLLFGPTITFVLVLTLGLFGTAFAWYWLFSRYLVDSKLAAAVGGLFCGFAPAMISHANAHPNFVVLLLLPVIAAQLIRMARLGETDGGPRPFGRRIRDAVLLGLLVALQIALGEEPLLIFALSFGLFGFVYYLHRPRTGLRAVRAMVPTVGLAGLITVALTEIPLYWQFFGPQSYRSIDHGPMGNDLKGLWEFPSESLGSLVFHAQYVAINPTEENSYFGWPLLILLVVTAILLRGNRVARAATVVIAFFTLLSLGSTLMIGRNDTGIALPWKWLEHVPLLNSVLESRFTMAAVPAIAVMLALATQRAVDYWRESATDWRPLAWFAALALALLPLTPTILPVVQRAPTPAFFADGTVRNYVSDGSVVVVPPPIPADARALNWQIDSGFSFPLAGGYFVGPTGIDKKGRYGPNDLPTATLLMQAQRENRVPAIDQAEREQALADLNYWQADVLVLPPTENTAALRATVNELLGFAGKRVDGVWVWDVRGRI